MLKFAEETRFFRQIIVLFIYLLFTIYLLYCTKPKLEMQLSDIWNLTA